MSSASTRKGVVIELPDSRFSTPASWSGRSSPGYEEKIKRPERHLHRTVHEYGFILSGELPPWEYESAEQQQGEFVLFRQGFFVHRRPGSIHGLEEGRTTETGLLMPFWRTGGIGNWFDDPNAAEETQWIPYDGA